MEKIYVHNDIHNYLSLKFNSLSVTEAIKCRFYKYSIDTYL